MTDGGPWWCGLNHLRTGVALGITLRSGVGLTTLALGSRGEYKEPCSFVSSENFTPPVVLAERARLF